MQVDQAALAAILVALINMIGSVLLTWLRYHYRVTDNHNGMNGEKKP